MKSSCNPENSRYDPYKQKKSYKFLIQKKKKWSSILPATLILKLKRKIGTKRGEKKERRREEWERERESLRDMRTTSVDERSERTAVMEWANDGDREWPMEMESSRTSQRALNSGEEAWRRVNEEASFFFLGLKAFD